MFDLVFIDGDKREYIEYYNLIIDKVKPGGFILADNVSGAEKYWIMKQLIPRPGYNQFNNMIQNETTIEDVIYLSVTDWCW